MISVVLADDHGVLRSGVRSLLEGEPDIEVVGEAANGEEAVEQAKALRPDLVLMDLSMPETSGLEAIQRLVALDTQARILVVTVYPEEEYLIPVLDAGAHGYLTKLCADQYLIHAVRTVARGETFLLPHATSLAMEHYKGGGKHSTDDALQILSERERAVLAFTAAGFSSSEIGRKLSISAKTVDTYRARAMQKLGLCHRSELVRFALRTGLLKES